MWERIYRMLVKEFIQIRRDRLTFGMMVGIPIIQLTLFGFAINSDPKHLPTAVLSAEESVFTRSFVTALRNSGYFQIVDHPTEGRLRTTKVPGAWSASQPGLHRLPPNLGEHTAEVLREAGLPEPVVERLAARAAKTTPSED